MQKNFLKLTMAKTCIAHAAARNSAPHLFGQKRIINFAPGGKSPEKKEAVETGGEKPEGPLLERYEKNKEKLDKGADYDPGSYKKTCEQLASGTNPQITAAELTMRLESGYSEMVKSIQKENKSFKDHGMDNWWKSLNTKKKIKANGVEQEIGPCKKVTIEKSIVSGKWEFTFYDGKGVAMFPMLADQGESVAPPQVEPPKQGETPTGLDNAPVNPEEQESMQNAPGVPITITEQNEMYNKEVVVDGKNKKTVLQSFNAKEGDILTVKRGYAKKNAARVAPWHAKYENGAFVYQDGPAKGRKLGTQGAPIYAGDVLILEQNPEARKETQLQEGKVNIDGKDYPVIEMRTITAGQTYLDLANQILNENKNIKDTLITPGEYATLLQKAHEKTGKGAKIPVVMPELNVQRQQEQQAEKATQQRANMAKEQKAAEARVALQTGELRSAALNQGRAMFLENRTIKRDALGKLVDDPDKFKKAWEVPDSMPGIAPLIYILKTEPVFKNLSKDPNFFRDRIRNAIYNGNKEALDMEDIFDFILKGTRAPSLALTAVNGQLNEPKGVDIGRWKLPEGFDPNTVKIAQGFLKSLKSEAASTARLILYDSDDKVWIKFIHKSKIYVVRFNYDEDSDSNLQVFQSDGKTEYADSDGYDQSFDVKNSDLLNSTDAARLAFENAVTPRLGYEMDYDNLTNLYEAWFQKNGKPKNANMDQSITTFFNDAIIGSTRFMDASGRLKLEEKAIVKAQREERDMKINWVQVLENNSSVNDHPKFSELMGDRAKFMKAWRENKIMGKTELINVIHTEDAFAGIQGIADEELGKRFYDATYQGNKEGLDAGDIYDDILQGSFLGRYFKANLIEKMEEYFDANGRQKIKKPNAQQAKEMEYCRSFARGASRILSIFETMDLSDKPITSEESFYSAYLKNNDRNVAFDAAIDKETNKDNFAVYNIEDLIKFQNTPGYTALKAKKAGQLVSADAEHITIHTNVFKSLNIKQEYSGLALKNLFKVYGFEQLVAGGHVTRANNTKGVPFYVLRSLPDNSLTAENFGAVINQGKDVNRQFIEKVNPQKRLENLLTKIFPLEDRESTMADVVSGEQSNVEVRAGAERAMSYRFMNDRFRKLDGVIDPATKKINEAQALVYLNQFLQRGLSRMTHRWNVDKAENSWTNLEVKTSLQNGEMQKTLEHIQKNPPKTVAEMEALLQDPATMAAMREGFVMAHDEKVETERKRVVDGEKARIDKWAKENPETVAKIKEDLASDLKKLNLKQEEIDRIVIEALPYFFYAGVTPEGFAVGAGVNFALDIGVGTIFIGASLFGGTAGVGIEAHTGYETPALGPFKFAVAGGAGLSVGKEFGVGYGVGAAIPINLNWFSQAWGNDPETDTTNYTLAPGVAYIPGVEAIGIPAVVPALTLTFSKNHKARFEEVRNTCFKQIGFDKIEAAPTPEAKVAAIKADPKNYALFKGYIGKENPTDAELLKAYEEQKIDLLNQLTEAYDPGWMNSLTLGIGYDPSSKKMIIGVGGSIYVGRETAASAYGKQDLDLQQEMGMAQKLEGQELSRSPRRTSTEFAEGGQRIKVGGAEGTRVTMPQVTQVSEAPKPGEAINNVDTLTKDLNAKLAPLNLSVTYDESMGQPGMFKLNIENLNNNTNYEIAADHAMKTAGVVYKDGNIYLTGTFMDPDHPLTIQRADYNFPMKSQGANVLSLITISDNPYRKFNDIYLSSPQVIRFQNGAPKPALQQQFGREIAIEGNIYTDFNAPQLKDKRIGALKEAEEGKVTNSQEYLANRQKLLSSKESAGTLDAAMESSGEYENFGKEFLKKHPKEYRKLSNAERNTDDFKALNKLLTDEFQAKYNRAPNDTELNFMRNVLVDLTAVENPDKITPDMTPEQKAKFARMRLLKFNNHLNATRNTIRQRFGQLIESHNSKLPPNSPLRIKRNAEEMTDYVVNDLKSAGRQLETALRHDKPDAEVHLSKIESYEYVAGSMGIRGFRGELYTRDLTNDKYKMLAASENYAQELINNPNSWKADLAKMILESHSPVPKLSDTPTYFEAHSLTKCALGSEIISVMVAEGDAYAHLLGKGAEGVKLRDALIGLAAADPNSPRDLTADETEAVKRLKTIVEGIRSAELQGLKHYVDPLNSDYRIELTEFDIRDGVYNRCTNYSEWMSEKIRIVAPGREIPQYATALAAYNEATEQIATEYSSKRQTIGAAVVTAFKVEGEPPPPPEKQKPVEPVAAPEEEVDLNIPPLGRNLKPIKYDPNAKEPATDVPDEQGAAPE